MFHNPFSLLKLSSDASVVFIADAHFGPHRRELLSLFDEILTNKAEVTHLFLMGDIFDLLIGGFSHLQKINQEAIDKINALSQQIDLYYLEGNHDFALEEIFPLVNVIPLTQQPFELIWNEKKVLLSHGDIFTPLGYRLYSSFIRSKWVLKVLNILTFNWVNSWFIAWQHDRLIPKKICHPIDSFEEKTSQRLTYYEPCDVIVEGHFHQGKMWHEKGREYVGLPSFACSGEVALLTCEGFTFTRTL